MLILKKIAIKNFLSSGQNPMKFDLHKHKTTLLSGSNGAGKSTLVDALCFALYGKAFRNINKPQLVNNVNNKNCEVTLDFVIGNTEYQIIRGMKPTIFQIWKDGDLIDQDAAARDYQEMLERDIINMSYSAFCQVIVLGNANWTAFMSLTPADRRKVLEDMLGIQIFTIMSTLLKEDQANLRSDMKDLNAKIAVLQNTIELVEKHKNDIKNRTEGAIEEKKTKIAELENLIEPAKKTRDELTEKIDKIKNTISNETEVLASLDSVQKEINKFEVEEKRVTKEIKFYETNADCPTCTRELDDKFRDMMLKERKAHSKRLENDKNKVTTEFDKLSGKINKYRKLSKGMAQLNDRYQDVVMDIHTWNNSIKQIQSDIESLREDKPDVDNHDYQSDLNVLITEKNALVEERDMQSIAIEMLKDDGIKSQIIKQYIPVINTLVNRYLERMNFFVKFHLNEKFDMEIKALNKENMSYESFSQGERMRIDLAILFTWRDIIRKKKMNFCNLLILDEIMDSSLDDAGTEDFLDIIKSLTPDNNVVIISQKSDQISDKFDSVLEIVKKKNFTRIKR